MDVNIEDELSLLHVGRITYLEERGRSRFLRFAAE